MIRCRQVDQPLVEQVIPGVRFSQAVALSIDFLLSGGLGLQGESEQGLSDQA